MVEKNYKSNPLYKRLVSLKHGPKTDLAAGVINNSDAIVLLFHIIPQFGLKTLLDFSQEWRGSNTLSNYFGPHNGYTATDFSSRKVLVFGYGPASGAPKRPPFWYRQRNSNPKVTYTNALTVDGFKRLSFLLQRLDVIDA
jgi:hypothetical protein